MTPNRTTSASPYHSTWPVCRCLGHNASGRPILGPSIAFSDIVLVLALAIGDGVYFLRG